MDIGKAFTFVFEDKGWIAKILIAAAIIALLNHGVDLLITTGGMSVDPDDVTRLAISQTGVDHLCYGAGTLPGSMFLLAYKGQIPLVGVPAFVRWFFGASTFADSPICRALRNRMTFGPSQNAMSSAVMAAAPDRTVMYRKTPNPGGSNV